MFLFITSLRHPTNCHSYERVGHLLENTLRSVCNQSSDCFKVLVVCNQIPDINVNQCVEFLEVDFPAPSSLNQPQTGMAAIRIDRGSKYMAGLIYARRYQPAFVMFFDADDYISNRIVEHVDSQPDRCGWYIDRGYRYQFGDTQLSHLSDFHHHCGTGIIYPYSTLDIPAKLTEKPTILSIQAHTEEKYLKNILGSHRAAVGFHQSRGYIFKPLPFTGAIWVLGNGENHSGSCGNPGDIPITEEISAEFAFEPALPCE
ncbi:MAG: glycosyltransferase family A protein [Gammaproteobacteria bacterium]|nr:MAG: glycosyltransferase family A protein [Gammaproteobacteria bacterium]